MESTPAMIIDPEATAEQRDALQRFEQAAPGFTIEELSAAMETVERYPGATENLLIFTRRLGRCGLLLAAWRDMHQTDAIVNTRFDTETEAVIEANSRFKELYPKLSRQAGGIVQRKNEEQITPEAAKRELTRLRFAIFAQRLTDTTLSDSSGSTFESLDDTGTG